MKTHSRTSATTPPASRKTRTQPIPPPDNTPRYIHPVNRKARKWTIERETGIDPWFVAASVLLCASEIVGDRIPGSYMEKLNIYAEGVYKAKRNERFRSKVRGRHGDDYLHMYMQQWLADLLHVDRSPFHDMLPREFCWPNEGSWLYRRHSCNFNIPTTYR